MTNQSKHAGRGIAGWGIALGAVLGAVFGVVVGHIAIWLGIGIAIGMAIGATFRRKETECPVCAQIHRAHETKTEQLSAGS